MVIWVDRNRVYDLYMAGSGLVREWSRYPETWTVPGGCIKCTSNSVLIILVGETVWAQVEMDYII